MLHEKIKLLHTTCKFLWDNGKKEVEYSANNKRVVSIVKEINKVSETVVEEITFNIEIMRPEIPDNSNKILVISKTLTSSWFHKRE